MAVGFADMVGFTMLSQHLGDEELAAVVSRFEELAHDTVVALGGRVVKMIGDEAMFVVPTAEGAAEIGLSLAEAYADDDLLSDVRVALALGPVLVKDGDFYGPVVNLASRLVGVANPGTVLISDESATRSEDEGATDFDTRPFGPATSRTSGGCRCGSCPGPAPSPAPTAAATCGGSDWAGAAANSTSCASGARGSVTAAIRRPGIPSRRCSVSQPSRRAVAIPWASEGEVPLEGGDRLTP